MYYDETDHLETYEKSIKHLKHKIKNIIEHKENKEISDLLTEQFESRIKLLDEILQYVEKKDIKHLTQQLDRYRHAMCVAMEQYLNDLKLTKTQLESLSKHSMNLKTLEETIQKTETISQQFCGEYFLTLDKSLRFATF